MVYTIDLDGNLTFVNSYGQRLLGYNEEEFVGKPYLDFVVPEFRESAAQAFRNLLQTGELRDFEFVLQLKSGAVVYLEVNGRLLRCNGELIGGIGIARDITERKQVERQLQMFSKAVNSAYDSAVIIDQDGYILYANPAASRIFACEPDSFNGKNASMFYPEVEQSRWLIQQAEAGGWSGEVICQRSNGNFFPALVSVGSIHDEDGNTTAISVICRDITEQKQIQAELAASNIELERASRLKSEFLANMSHELRTPLTSVLGFSSLLQQQIFGSLNDKQQLYVRHIHQSGEHLLNLINDVLDLSKVEAGQMTLHLSAISIPELCQETMALVSEQARNRRLTVSHLTQTNLPPFIGDDLRLRQMLLNLLSNAIKFSEEGGEIGLEATVEERNLLLTVWDKGVGIAEEQQHLLFQPFQQLESSLNRRHTGTGLGLALTLRLAELHGGTVRLQSKVGEGSRFTICLPIAFHNQLQGSSNPKPVTEAQPVPMAGEATSNQVLIVEDHPVNAMLLQDILQHWGYETHRVEDGIQALSWLESHHPDSILMDIHLPGLDGLEVTRRIKANPAWRHIPVIATTALVMAGDRDRCLAAGMQDYLSKPLNHEKLVAVLARYTATRFEDEEQEALASD